MGTKFACRGFTRWFEGRATIAALARCLGREGMFHVEILECKERTNETRSHSAQSKAVHLCARRRCIRCIRAGNGAAHRRRAAETRPGAEGKIAATGGE